MKVHDFRVGKFFGLEFLVKGVCGFRGLVTAVVSQGEGKSFLKRKPARRVSEQSRAKVCDTLHRAVIGLRSRGQGSS